MRRWLIVLTCVSLLGGSSAWAGEILVKWQRPTKYTDNSPIFLKTHEVCYGTTLGSWPNCIDLSTTPYPGMLEYRISGLQNGVQYFVVARTIDSEGNKSAPSAEMSLIAADPIQPPPISGIPFSGGTISNPGDYILTQDVASSSGNAISINVSNVRLDCDGHKVTFGTSSGGVGIAIGNVSDIEVFGCIVEMGGNTGGIGIGRDATTLGNSIKIHDNTVNMFHASKGGIVFDNYDAHTSGHEIYRNNVLFRNTTDQSPAIGAKESGWDWIGKIYENTIVLENISRSNGYPSAIWPGRGSEVYKNTITTDSSNGQHQTFYGWNVDDTYLHDNSVELGASLTRVFFMDGGSENVTILWNRVVSTNTGTTGAPFRIRYGSHDVHVGFNDFITTGSDIACRTGSRDPSKGDSYSLYFYHNRCKGATALAVVSAAHDYYFWSNTFDGTVKIEGTADSSSVGKYLSNINFHFDAFNGQVTGNPRSSGHDLADNGLTFCKRPPYKAYRT